jgi:hypothetical protein
MDQERLPYLREGCPYRTLLFLKIGGFMAFPDGTDVLIDKLTSLNSD